MDGKISIIRSSIFSQRKKDAVCSLFVFLFGFLARRPCRESFFLWESMREVLMTSPVGVVFVGIEKSKEKLSSDP